MIVQLEGYNHRCLRQVLQPLGRWRELGLREITFEIDRSGSDSTVVKRGADRAQASARGFGYTSASRRGKSLPQPYTRGSPLLQT